MNKPLLDKLLKSAVEKGDVRGVAAIVSNDKETIYKAGFGISGTGKCQGMNADTVIWIASMTKAITATAAMQLVERGYLTLDTPASLILPQLKSIKVLEGFDENNIPKLRSPKSDITLRQLLTHTAGFGYDVWHKPIKDFIKSTNMPSRSSGSPEALLTPLMFDPGTSWAYSIAIDWVGLMIEEITKQKLGSYLKTNIFKPLGMNSTGFIINNAMQTKLATMYKRENGTLSPDPKFQMKQNPELESGGGGLYSTLNDYILFLRMLLNNGSSNNQQLLLPDTIQKMFTNHTGTDVDMKMCSTNQLISRDVDFFPSTKKSWGLSFMRNEEATETGRATGSLGWAGLSNCYFWIDPGNKISGVFGTQILPFIDEKAFPLYINFEKTVYRSLLKEN
jgi:CubicO group peptidase (beta-lactamase class C family)